MKIQGEFDDEMQSLIRDYERRLRLSSGRPFVALYDLARGSDGHDQAQRLPTFHEIVKSLSSREKSKWGPSPASPEEALMNRPHASVN